MKKFVVKKIVTMMFTMMLTAGLSGSAIAAPQDTEGNTDASGVNLKIVFESILSDSKAAGELLPKENDKGTGAGAESTAKKPDVLDKMLEFIVSEKESTGIVIDARSYSLEGTFSPLIYDEEGNIVYGKDNIDKDKAISQGLVEYCANLEAVDKGTRARDNPLIIVATGTRSGCNSANKVNVVVSMADAERIKKAEAEHGVLTKMAVVFVK